MPKENLFAKSTVTKLKKVNTLKTVLNWLTISPQYKMNNSYCADQTNEESLFSSICISHGCKNMDGNKSHGDIKSSMGGFEFALNKV